MRILAACGSAAALVIVVAAALVVTGHHGIPHRSSRTAGTTSTLAGPAHPCKVAVGATSDAALRSYTAAFATQIVQEAPPTGSTPCGAGEMSRWGQLVIQPVVANGQPYGELVATDPGHVLKLTAAEYGSYHQVGGRNGNRAQSLAGLPRRLSTTKSGKGLELVTDFGAIVSQGPDQTGFFVIGIGWKYWQSHGAETGPLGMPASNIWYDHAGDLWQDYEHGRLHFSTAGQFTFTPVQDPASKLPAKYRNRLVTHTDGTAWYVDPKGVRHWIPDATTWGCLTARHLKEIDNVAGYATYSLPLGPPATCGS